MKLSTLLLPWAFTVSHLGRAKFISPPVSIFSKSSEHNPKGSISVLLGVSSFQANDSRSVKIREALRLIQERLKAHSYDYKLAIVKYTHKHEKNCYKSFEGGDVSSIATELLNDRSSVSKYDMTWDVVTRALASPLPQDKTAKHIIIAITDSPAYLCNGNPKACFFWTSPLNRLKDLAATVPCKEHRHISYDEMKAVLKKAEKTGQQQVYILTSRHYSTQYLEDLDEMEAGGAVSVVPVGYKYALLTDTIGRMFD